MGDAGVIAQRYSLVLFGNHQRLELQSWQPETERTVAGAVRLEAGHLVPPQAAGREPARRQDAVRGKAWPAAEPEPAAWTDRPHRSRFRNRQGSPGIYADAPFEVYFDNLKVTANQ